MGQCKHIIRKRRNYDRLEQDTKVISLSFLDFCCFYVCSRLFLLKKSLQQINPIAGKSVNTVVKATVMSKLSAKSMSQFGLPRLMLELATVARCSRRTGNLYLLPGGSRSPLWTDRI